VSALTAIFGVVLVFGTVAQAQELGASRPVPILDSTGGERGGAPEQAGRGGGRPSGRPDAASAGTPVNDGPVRETARGTLGGGNGGAARTAPASDAGSGGATERVDDRGALGRTGGGAVAPVRERVAPAAPQNAPGRFAGDQATPAPIEGRVRPVREAVEPVQRTVEPIIAPVQRRVSPVVEPVERAVGQTAEPVQRRVDAVVEPIAEPVRQTAGTVTKTVEPVLKPVRETADPVVKPVQKTVDPLVEPLRNTVDPVLKPAVDQDKGNTDPLAEPVRDLGKEAKVARPVAPATPSRLTEDSSVSTPMPAGAGNANPASSPSLSSTPALAEQALAKGTIDSPATPLAEMAQGGISTEASSGLATATGRATFADDLGGASPAHESLAGGHRVAPTTAGERPALASSFPVEGRPALLDPATPTTQRIAAGHPPQPLPFSIPLPTLPASGNAPGGAASSSGGEAPHAGGVLALVLLAFVGGRSVWRCREFFRPDSVYGPIVNQPG
jgi:hypothetical protein